MSQTARSPRFHSVKRRGAATGDEVADHVHGAFPLPMGMEREGRDAS